MLNTKLLAVLSERLICVVRVRVPRYEIAKASEKVCCLKWDVLKNCFMPTYRMALQYLLAVSAKVAFVRTFRCERLKSIVVGLGPKAEVPHVM